MKKQLYVLTEENEFDNGEVAFYTILASYDKDLLIKEMNEIIKDDLEGFIKENGVEVRKDDYFTTNCINGYMKLEIVPLNFA